MSEVMGVSEVVMGLSIVQGSPLLTPQVGEITLSAFLHVAKAYRLNKPPHKWENYSPS